MRHLAILLVAFGLLTGTARADDRGFLQGVLEDALSGAGREVRITGFEGALSGAARLETLTIADGNGVWLELRSAVLDWNRAALLRGRLEVTELSAQALVVDRAPVRDPELPAPEATSFAVPELPIAVNIGKLAIAKITLGTPLLGDPVALSLKGSASLADGIGQVDLDLARVDSSEGQIVLRGGINADRLSVQLDLREGPQGIAARLLSLPGTPSVELVVEGEGPISDFAADLRFSTDGTRRLTGRAALQKLGDDTGFEARLEGDLRPLTSPEYHAFLGDALNLEAHGTKFADGRLNLEALRLRTEALALVGDLALRSDGWPARADLTGKIIAPDGEILLALPGTPAYVAGADIALRYDVATGEDWTLDALLSGLRRDGLTTKRMALEGRGTLAPKAAHVDGTLDLSLEGLGLEDPALAEAIGSALSGQVEFDWAKGDPLRFGKVDLSGPDYALRGTAEVEGVEGQVDLAITLDAAFEAQQLERFSALAGTDLSGAADLRLGGTLSPVAGAFDLKLDGVARNLRTGNAQTDAVLGPRTTVALDAVRDSSGLNLRALAVKTEAVQVAGHGTIATGASDLVMRVRLDNLALLVDGVEGPVVLDGTAKQRGDVWSVAGDLEAPAQTRGAMSADVTLVDGSAGPFRSDLKLRATALEAFAGLAGVPLTGALSLGGTVSGDLRGARFDTVLDGQTENLSVGIAQVDALLAGQTDLALRATRGADGSVQVGALTVRGTGLRADVSGVVKGATLDLDMDATLSDLARIAPEFSGSLRVDGTVSRSGGPYRIVADMQGPARASARVDGTLTGDAKRADLGLTGTVPLALANGFIAPNLASGSAAFDLRVKGPMALSSVTGTVRTQGAQFTAPAAALSLKSVDADVRITGGTAVLDVTGAVSSGGGFSAQGQVAMSDKNNADISIDLTQVVLTDPGLYETALGGRVTLRGPLSGGARIGGAIQIGTIELRIPAGAGGGGSALDGLVHLNEPSAVRQTRARAGLLKRRSGAKSGAVYPLDLMITAPGRVFVRGRGLDAELGGDLYLRGSTAKMVPAGRFDLIRGRLDILGQRLTLTEASVQMQGDLDPFIRAVATTEAKGTTIRITIEGPASTPEVTFSSTPELPQDEVLARLLFDRDLTQISPLQALQLANAVRVLAGRGGEGIVGRLRQNFGLDDFDVQTGKDGTVGLRAGRYISEKAYTDVTIDSTGKSKINLNLDVTPNVTIRGSVGSDGGTGLGLYFEKDY